MPNSRFKTLLVILSTASALALVACGGKAALGESCDEQGSVDACDEGAVCAKNTSDALQCLKQCTEQADCAAEEECNGVEGSSVKACRPKDDGGGTGGGGGSKK